MSTAPRRPRRAVRPPGTVGTDESVLRSTLPAAPSGAGSTGARPARPTAQPTAQPTARPAAGAPARPTADPSDDLWRATRSADDADQGWGREEPSSNDDRLRREKPPHW